MQRFFNTAAFSIPPTGTYGNSARNIIVGPGTQATNMSLQKIIPLPNAPPDHGAGAGEQRLQQGAVGIDRYGGQLADVRPGHLGALHAQRDVLDQGGVLKP